jgi:hypothetical protein
MSPSYLIAYQSHVRNIGTGCKQKKKWVYVFLKCILLNRVQNSGCIIICKQISNDKNFYKEKSEGTMKIDNRLIIGLFKRSLTAMSWFRRLFADLSPRMPAFDPDSVHVGFLVDRLALGQVPPLPSISVFPHQFYSSDAPLDGQMEQTNHLHHRTAQ